MYIQVRCDFLGSKFTQFEILKPDMIRLKVKRETGNVKVKMSLFALGRKFVMSLYPGASNLHSNFTVSLVDSHGVMTPHSTDLDLIYTGHLQGDDLSGVDMVNVENVWVGRIFTGETIFSIEPLSLHDARSHPHHMIFYDVRDLTVNQSESASSFCREIFFDRDGRLQFKNETSRNSHHMESDRRDNYDKPKLHKYNKESNSRFVRNILTLNSCEVLAVADYRALLGIGQGSVQKMVGILINIYQSVDRIFNSTEFANFVNQRIVLKAVLVHTSFSYVYPGSIHYNMEESFNDATKFVYSLADFPYFAQFCLMHLTSQRNYGEMLGLASTAEASGSEWNNGICSGRRGVARNVGLSTPIRLTGEQMPISKYFTVIAHELGHNWGSDHDKDDSGPCSPSSEEGGKYLMWARSGMEIDANSLKFSPCSNAEISQVLEAKAHKCFLPYNINSSYCGNGLLDYGEECDVGILQEDPCCQENCRLRTNATCSPFSHPCCTSDCHIAPSTQLCRDSTTTQCYSTPYCSGNDFRKCPSPEALPNNSSCESRGTCWYGRCQTYCENLGRGSSPPRQLEPCTCDENTETMCTHCCRDAASPKDCVQMNLKMEDGEPCLIGFCKNGVCHLSQVSDIYGQSRSVVGSKYLHFVHTLKCIMLPAFLFALN
ncbi:disintegrin and metalloproteinase domain-containing protein 17 [Biomphalaria pfeifferi]|uniref:Disintegrin and metalloproteinase domain-containing protein 17 n=1 Tax=Biomphalaria pfeifferi TaxID=112525 RepID=A0AAD8AXX5_BIOPF|nr:disintegrin and metalloproteinase domain-containing protein 17 [Biomphalaria pfeifferi]